MQDTPFGVPGDVSRDGVESSRAVADEPAGFFSPGVMVPPVLGPPDRGTFVQVYFSGKESFSVIFGNSFRSQFEAWTTFEGMEALANELTAHLEKARKARG